MRDLQRVGQPVAPGPRADGGDVQRVSDARQRLRLRPGHLGDPAVALQDPPLQRRVSPRPRGQALGAARVGPLRRQEFRLRGGQALHAQTVAGVQAGGRHLTFDT